MSTLEGAPIEPPAVGFHAANQGRAHADQTAMATGAGCIGLVSMMALKAEEVSKVYVVDVMQKGLDKALELGADGVINASQEDVVEAMLCVAGRAKATIVLVGYSKTDEMTLPVSQVLDKELTLRSVFRYRHIYPMAIDAVASGRVNLKGIITDVFSFDDIQNAMDKSITEKATIVKAVVKLLGP